MSKRNHRHKKTISTIEKERRKILAQKRKKLENGDKIIIEIYTGSLGIEHYCYKEKASVN